MTGPIRQRVEFRCTDERAVSRHGTVLSLHGELDSYGACVLQARVSDIRGQARACCVADLAGLAFSDPVCIGVLVRHCWQILGRGGSFCAGWVAGRRAPGPVRHRLLSWFECTTPSRKPASALPYAGRRALKRIPRVLEPT